MLFLSDKNWCKSLKQLLITDIFKTFKLVLG